MQEILKDKIKDYIGCEVYYKKSPNSKEINGILDILDDKVYIFNNIRQSGMTMELSLGLQKCKEYDKKYIYVIPVKIDSKIFLDGGRKFYVKIQDTNTKIKLEEKNDLLLLLT